MVSNEPLNVCITFDFDAMSLWGAAFDQWTPTPISRGEFGGRVAVPRLLDLLKDEGIPATFFTPGHTVDCFPEVCRRIVAEGHEMGHHGYFHETPTTLDRQEEIAVLDKGIAAMENHLDGYKPVGYRSPAWDHSPDTPELLIEYGFEYDSSMMAQDFEPYWVRVGDQMHQDRGVEWGEESSLVELPVSWTLDDLPQLDLVLSPTFLLPGTHNPEDIERRWLADLEWAAEKIPGGLFNMTFHPQCIGRGARLRIVENMIARGRDLGANFVTCREAAKGWAAKQPTPA